MMCSGTKVMEFVVPGSTLCDNSVLQTLGTRFITHLLGRGYA